MKSFVRMKSFAKMRSSTSLRDHDYFIQQFFQNGEIGERVGSLFEATVSSTLMRSGFKPWPLHDLAVGNLSVNIGGQRKKRFQIPEEGFSVNRKINSLIIENNHLNGQQREVKDMFDKLERIIENFQTSNLANPQLFIHDYFAVIRNKIDLSGSNDRKYSKKI